MRKHIVTSLIGIALIAMPLAASAQTVFYSAPANPATAQLIALYTQLIQLLQQELLVLQKGQGGSPPSPASATLTATPSSGASPLNVSFVGTGVKGGQQYIIDYGDGSHSDALAALDVCMHLADGSGGCPKAQASHTYATAGTYTATLQPYIACMWTNPRCMIATVPLATTVVIV